MTGNPFKSCETIDQVAEMANRCLWGVNGEVNRFTSYRHHLLASPNVGCYECVTLFDVQHIEISADEDEDVICPNCGSNSVVGSKDGTAVTLADLS